MNKILMTRIAVVLLLIIGIALVVWSRLYVPDYPEGVLYDKATYSIKPQTILTSLAQGKTDVFVPLTTEPEGSWPILWPSGSFVWSQKDYMAVANALHKLVWNESLENWHLIRASFQIDQCRDIFGRIDNANLSFFQRQEGSNNVHGFWISPMLGNVTAGDQYSQRSGWTADWDIIDLNKMKINNVDAALLVAERNGGEKVRLEAKNDCRINLLLAPDRFENDLLSHPFSRYSWGWSVIYWSNESNSDPLFSIVIDPYTGRYKILNTK